MDKNHNKFINEFIDKTINDKDTEDRLLITYSKKEYDVQICTTMCFSNIVKSWAHLSEYISELSQEPVKSFFLNKIKDLNTFLENDL